MPSALQPLPESGVFLAALVSVILNALFNDVETGEEAKRQSIVAASGAKRA